MTKKYLVKIKPLEPYFFGDENTIRIGEENSYHITSLLTPSATTIMGMLRYIILKQTGNLLTFDGNDTSEKQEAIKSLVGEYSFVPGKTNEAGKEVKQEFGVIKEVSPLFLMKGEDIYIKAPLNHKTSADIYKPISVNTEVETSYGKILLPNKKEFSAKKTVENHMYVNINTGDINIEIKREKSDPDYGKEVDGIFSYYEKITLRKADTKDNFMKKMFCVLHKDYCFCVTADIDDAVVPQNDICYMGREKSSFALEFCEGFSLDDKIKNSAIYNAEMPFAYALSDIVVKEKPAYKAFAMVQTQNLRHLEMDYKRKHISTNKKLHSVISAGSVFYNPADIISVMTNDNSDKFGLNKIIVFGGKQNEC